LPVSNRAYSFLLLNFNSDTLHQPRKPLDEAAGTPGKSTLQSDCASIYM
jgi:hypothetical protein